MDATTQKQINVAYDDSDIDDNLMILKLIVADLSSNAVNARILSQCIAACNRYIQQCIDIRSRKINTLSKPNQNNTNTHQRLQCDKIKTTKSLKRKRRNVQNNNTITLRNDFISEPLHKKQKLSDSYNKHQEDEEDIKSELSENESPNESSIVNNMDISHTHTASDCDSDSDSDDSDIQYSQQLDDNLNALSQFCYNNTDIIEDVNINAKKKLCFRNAPNRKKNGFDMNNKNHVKIAREQVLKHRIYLLNKKDLKEFNLDSNESEMFVYVDFMMNKIQQNENINNGKLRCDVCRHEMYILSEKHKHIPAAMMNISRFDHSIYHSSANIKTLECGMCNIMRGKDNMKVFLIKMENVLAKPNSKECVRVLRSFQFKINLHFLKLDLRGTTTNSTQNVICSSPANNVLIQHLKTIKNTQTTHPCLCA